MLDRVIYVLVYAGVAIALFVVLVVALSVIGACRLAQIAVRSVQPKLSPRPT